jgi:hypothetical protein
MRYAGNFHPEWGYLAPAPSFMRTVRIVIVAAAVGATASAAVVFALLERPGADTSVAARTLATPEAAGPATTGAQPPAQTTAQLPAQVNSQRDANVPTAHNELQLAKPVAAIGSVQTPAMPATNEIGSRSTAQTPAATAALAETPPVTPALTDATPAPLHDQSAAAADATAAPKKVVKKHRSTSRYASREQGLDGRPLELHGLFNAAPANEYSANDGYRSYSRDSRWGGYYPSRDAW